MHLCLDKTYITSVKQPAPDAVLLTTYVKRWPEVQHFYLCFLFVTILWCLNKVFVPVLLLYN